MVSSRQVPGQLRIKTSAGWVILKLVWNEATWVSLGLFGILSLIVLTSQGVRPESQVVFLVELAFPPLSAVLVVPLALLDRDYSMVEILNTAVTSSAMRIARRVSQVLMVPLALVVPLSGLLYAAANVSSASRTLIPPAMLGASAAALVLFLAGLTFSASTVTGSSAAGYGMAPAFFLAVASIRKFLPSIIQPFPIVSILRHDLAAFAVEPIVGIRLFWLNRIGYGALGVALVVLSLALLQKCRWGY